MRTPDITTRVLTEVIREKQVYGERPNSFTLLPFDYDCLCNDPTFKMFGKFEDDGTLIFSRVQVLVNQFIKQSYAIDCFGRIVEI
jgi:hypothetical protein